MALGLCGAASVVSMFSTRVRGAAVPYAAPPFVFERLLRIFSPLGGAACSLRLCRDIGRAMCLLAAPVAGRGQPRRCGSGPAPMQLRSHPSTSSSLPQTSLSGPEPLPGSSKSVIWQQRVGAVHRSGPRRSQASHSPHPRFQTMKTAAATLKGFEVLRVIRRGHCLTCRPRVEDEVRIRNAAILTNTVRHYHPELWPLCSSS